MPEFWSRIPGGRVAKGQPYEWTCDADSRRGDVALLYRADAAKDIAHVFRVDNDDLWEDEHPLEPSKTTWYCDCTLVHTMHQPLLLWDLREEPRLQDWAALQVNFHDLSFEIPSHVWKALLSLAHPLDRIEMRRAGGA